MKSVKLRINGLQRQFIVEDDLVLLDLLREDLRLTGAKQSCDRKGQCGACTVIVNGKAARSCLLKVGSLNGAEIFTVEGLGTPQNPHLIQEAFVLAGAIQCGYCTPGLIMATKALLDENPNPGREEIKRALQRNLCRCTGYTRIIEAVELAARFLRGESSPEELRPKSTESQIGVSHPRPWSLLKACGLAEFTADIAVPGALELAVVRSPHHNAKIRHIDSSAAEKMPGVVGIMTAKDVRGTNSVGVAFKDQPLLCDDLAPVLGSPVAIVAAASKKQALAAVEEIRVEYEVLPRIATPEEALAEGALEVHPGTPNLCHARRQVKGDAAAALNASAALVSAEFYSQLIHQAPLEPEAAVAYLEGQGEEAQLVIIGRSIWIHYHVEVLQDTLGWGNIRYEEAFAGGQFGIKVDITSEAIAGAAALHFQRPVRYIPSLTESMWMTTKRHPFRMKARLGSDADGRLKGYEIDFIVENGAYMSIGPEVVSRALGMLSGGYHIPNVLADAKLVYTNNAWGGAARGAGPPQVNFALESAMDLLAAELKMDPYEFRRINALQPGQSMSTGHVAQEWAFGNCLEKIGPVYKRARQEAAAFKSGSIRRGVGLAGSSFGIGDPSDTSHVAVELEPDGVLAVYASVADPGEGNDAMLTQLASHVMGIPAAKVRLVTRDTEQTPNSGISAGSRQTYMSGKAMVNAIELLKDAMRESGAKTREDLLSRGKPTRYLATHTLPHTGMDMETGQGEVWESRCHGVQMAEVEVNLETGAVRILKMTAVVDAGTIINPLAVVCQLEGGMDMGAGMALREEYAHGETVDWITYRFPTMKTAFEMETILLESPRKGGPLGATGVGEFTLVPTHPAIINAIADAAGVRIYAMPATPEKILAALKAAAA
jgi:aldehyde oxidoreductase